jgi:hypothetical protein
LQGPRKFTQTGIFVLKIWQPCHHSSAGNRFFAIFQVIIIFSRCNYNFISDAAEAGLPDGTFSNQKSNLGKF